MAYKTILLNSSREGFPLPKEAKANGAITPGHLVQYDSTVGQIKVHATAGGTAAKMFAIEDSLQGKEIGTAYTTLNRCQFVHCAPGDEINALLATSNVIAAGDFLESAGNGCLRKSSAEASEIPGSIVGVALEAVTTTSAVARIRIEIV